MPSVEQNAIVLGCLEEEQPFAEWMLAILNLHQNTWILANVQLLRRWLKVDLGAITFNLKTGHVVSRFKQPLADQLVQVGFVE